jgi:hypothetical protein
MPRAARTAKPPPRIHYLTATLNAIDLGELQSVEVQHMPRILTRRGARSMPMQITLVADPLVCLGLAVGRRYRLVVRVRQGVRSAEMVHTAARAILSEITTEVGDLAPRTTLTLIVSGRLSTRAA